MSAYDEGLPLSRTQRTVRKAVEKAVTPLITALDDLVLSHCHEDDSDEEHLIYTCHECDGSGVDDHLAIVHEDGCLVGRAVAAMASVQ